MKNIDWNYGIITVLAAAFFLPFLGNVHLFDWDEINFAECAREMLATGEYLRPQINFSPFWEKPPLFIWFQALSMQFFGVNEYAARLPNAICGIVTLLVIYHLGKKLYDKTFGWLWVLAYIGSILPHLYFKSGIIDPWFNLFIFLSLIFVMRDTNSEQKSLLTKNIIIAGIFSGLAVLTKGPVGFLIAALAWVAKLLIYRELSVLKIKRFTLFGCFALLTALSWFGVEIIKNGTWFVSEFITYTIRLAKTEDAGHGGFVGYHFVVLFFGCFPASIFALRALLKRYNFFDEKVDFTRWMKILFWVVLILFSIVQSKIVHYSSMCYLPLTFLSALTLKSFLEDNKVMNWTKTLLVSVGVLLGLIIAAVPFIGQNIVLLKSFAARDAFALGNMDAEIDWTNTHSLVGFFLVATVLAFPIALKMRGILRGYAHLFLTTALFLQLVLVFYVGNIEGYSQRAALDFYENKQTEDCYVETFGFKSYAHLFYSRLKEPTNPKYFRNESSWLLRGTDVDKPTYFVGKINSKIEMDSLETLQFLYQKNGFVFYQRK